MDSQGFVPLQVVVGFQRLRILTADVPTVLHALLSSTEVEILINSERGPVVRPRHEATKWVYPMNERDEAARNTGPSPFYFQNHQDAVRQMQDYTTFPYPQPYVFDGQYSFPASSYRPQDDSAPPFEPELHSPSLPSPNFDLQNQKTLSGEASVFVPNGANYNTSINQEAGSVDPQTQTNPRPAVNGKVEEPLDVLDEENLASVVVVVMDPKDIPVIPALPMNGVNQPSPREQELLRSQTISWRFPDITVATQASTTVSIASGLSSLTAQDDSPTRNRNAETALTEKNLKKQLSQSGITEYPYSDFRSKAIDAREFSQKSSRESTSMVNLYQFWADFLCNYWVPSMYSEFLQLAVEDANHSRRGGLLKLFSMYERLLDVKFRMSLWNDFVRLAGEDYRNGHFSGIESVWRIRRNLLEKSGKHVIIQDGDVSRLVEAEIQQQWDIDRLRKESKPAGLVLVPYTTVTLRE
jgi:la-related protein 1